jgi:hypothetical protein
MKCNILKSVFDPEVTHKLKRASQRAFGQRGEPLLTIAVERESAFVGKNILRSLTEAAREVH